MTDEPVTVKKMDPADKARWLEALRSGQYQQGQKRLRTSADCFCCLGVLCDVIDRARWQLFQGDWHFDIVIDENGYPVDEHDTELPDELRRRLGISLDAQEKLVNMNDGRSAHTNVVTGETVDAVPGKPFHEIADWIEKNL